MESKIGKEQVLKIVDACFHAYASDYRYEAKEMASEIFDEFCEQQTKAKP